MRIITPQDAAFDPSGNSTGIFQNSGSVFQTISIPANVTTADVVLFTSPGALYLIAAASTLITPATTGSFQGEFNYTLNGVAGYTGVGTVDLSIASPNNVTYNAFFYADASTQVKWRYEVILLTGGPAEVQLSMQFYRVA